MNDTINSEPIEKLVSTNRVSLMLLMENLYFLVLGVEYVSHSVEIHHGSEGAGGRRSQFSLIEIVFFSLAPR